MILFPIALLWLAAVMFWIIRNSLNEPDAPPRERRRWLPRRPRPGPTRPRRPGSRDATASRSARRGTRS